MVFADVARSGCNHVLSHTRRPPVPVFPLVLARNRYLRKEHFAHGHRWCRWREQENNRIWQSIFTDGGTRDHTSTIPKAKQQTLPRFLKSSSRVCCLSPSKSWRRSTIPLAGVTATLLVLLSGVRGGGEENSPPLLLPSRVAGDGLPGKPGPATSPAAAAAAAAVVASSPLVMPRIPPTVAFASCAIFCVLASILQR